MKSPTAQQLQSSSVVHMIQKKLYNAHSNHGAGIYIYIPTFTINTQPFMDGIWYWDSKLSGIKLQKHL